MGKDMRKNKQSMVELCPLWENHKGHMTYLAGTSGNVKYLVFPNKNIKSSRSPTHRLFVTKTQSEYVNKTEGEYSNDKSYPKQSEMDYDKPKQGPDSEYDENRNNDPYDDSGEIPF